MRFREAELALTAKRRSWQILSPKVNYENAQMDKNNHFHTLEVSQERAAMGEVFMLENG